MGYLLYTSLLLIITLRFPCDGRKISSTIKKCQNIMKMTVGIKFQLNLPTFIFGPNLCRKGVSCGKEKFENHPWSIHIQISVGTKFQLKWTILIFLTKFCLKRIFLIRNGKSENHHWALNIWIALGTKIPQTENLDFLDQICANRVFMFKNEKKEHDHWILHIWISHSTKF